jgi:hypothetical protein
MTNETYELAQARVEALEKEVNLLKQFIVRDYQRKDISAETALYLFERFKQEQNEDSQRDTESRAL